MGGYKEHKIFDILKRKSIIIKYIVLIALILIVTLALKIEITKEKSAIEEQVVYTESSELGYEVHLKENDFFKDDYLKEDNQYIASLIDYIEADFKYQLEASKPNINYDYNYRIVAEIDVRDKESQKALYQHEEVLLEDKGEFNTKSKLKITEPIKIDYNKYNDLVNKFVSLYDLKDAETTLIVNMYVNSADKPALTLSIPLTNETMAIDFESNTVNGNSISVTNIENKNRLTIGMIVLLILDLLLVLKLVRFIKDTKDEKAVYNMRLRKIMANYGSYIQKLYNEFDFTGYQMLEIKSIEDLLQVRETLNKPVLMTEQASAMETYFFIPADKDIYVYELKVGNLRKKNKGKRYRVKDEENV